MTIQFSSTNPSKANLLAPAYQAVTHRPAFILNMAVFLALLSSYLPVSATPAESDVELLVATNLQAISRLHKTTGRTIVLYVSSPECGYCERLEEDILKPLIRSGDYENDVILRNMNWDSSIPIVNFSGDKQIPADFLLEYAIVVTPTVLFLRGDGSEASTRIVGYQGSDFYWYYLDLAIEHANAGK